MSAVENMIIIILIIIAIIALAYYILSKEAEKIETKTRYSYDELQQLVLKMFDDYTSANISGMGLTRQAMKKQEEHRKSVASMVRTCCSGNAGSRIVTKDMIYGYLVNLGLNDDSIEYTIPFRQPRLMSARQMFETMMYMNDKEGESGFLNLHEKYDFMIPVTCESNTVRYEVSDDDIWKMYCKEKYLLSLQDKLQIITQMLFSDTIGLGVIDSINHQKGCIEEIQCGLNGQQQYVYNYKKEIADDEELVNARYSKDAVHVCIKGINIWFSFLRFKSENEMERVIRNLIKDSYAGELTINNPCTMVETADGRRVTVSRPPMTDSWAALIRKFDTLKQTELDELYHIKKDAEKVNKLMSFLARAGANITITGEMSSGKTSVFRALLKKIRPDLSLRIVEAGSFELNVRQFLHNANNLAIRIAGSVTVERALEFLRKTTGQVFCIGEVTGHLLANLALDLGKISQQLLMSAHYISTDAMVQDFTAAKMSKGNYSDEKLAEMDVVSILQFDIHLRAVNGVRYVSYINEIVPEFDFDKGYDLENITEMNASVKAVESIREVRKQLGTMRTYSIRPILAFNEETEQYEYYARPSERCMEKASWYMGIEQYEEFEEFLEELGMKAGGSDES